MCVSRESFVQPSVIGASLIRETTVCSIYYFNRKAHLGASNVSCKFVSGQEKSLQELFETTKIISVDLLIDKTPVVRQN